MLNFLVLPALSRFLVKGVVGNLVSGSRFQKSAGFFFFF